MPRRPQPPSAVGLSQTIPLDIRRDLQKLDTKANTLHTATEANATATASKFGPPQLPQISQYVSKDLAAGGSNQLNLTGLQGLVSEAQFAQKAGTAAGGNATEINGVPVNATVVHVVPLAKLTIGGTNGSISLNANGLIVAHVDPT